MNNTKIDNWIEMEVQKCPKDILNRIGEIAIRQQIKEEFKSILRHCEVNDLATRIFNYSKIEGTKIEDFSYRFLKTELGEMITSIRFIGGDLNKPAVFLIFKTFELSELADIHRIGEIVSQEYALFNPKRMRWYSSTIENNLIESTAFVSGDLVYVSGFLDHLKEMPLPHQFDKVQLVVTESLDWYDNYKISYENICKKWPSFVEMSQLESIASLHDMIEKKLLFEIFIEDKWAGIIGANTGQEKYLKGYYIVEEFLMERFRGKDFAAAVQRHLIENLPCQPDDMLYGTIHHDNLPSYRTALRTGRKPVGMYVFSEL